MTDLVAAVREVLTAIDFPFSSLKRVWATRTPKVVLALGRLRPGDTLASVVSWGQPGVAVFGSRKQIGFLNDHWEERISSGSYDEIRRSCVKFLVEAGVALKDPDDPNRAPNSPATGYLLSPEFGRLLAAHGTPAWATRLAGFKRQHESLRQRLRQEREQRMLRVTLPDGSPLTLSPGKHNALQIAIVERFVPQFVRQPEMIYIADALSRQLYKNDLLMEEVGLFALDHRLLPDIIVLDRERGWLIIIEAVAASGQISPVRRIELLRLLENSRFPPVFVSAFSDERTFRRFADALAWETEAWIAEHPTHMIHFNGERFLGPYQT